MICTEVGELMQRQLDHDLDEKELTLLMTHLSECIACKDLFERLTLLSGSLEQLPRVTPSINIVDSILPELDAIDRQRSSVKNKRYSRMRWMTTAASVAAAAAVVFIMSMGWNGSSSNDNVTYDVAYSSETRIADPYDVAPMSRMDDVYADRSTSLSEVGHFNIEPLSSPSSIAQYELDKNNKEKYGSEQAETEQALPPKAGISSITKNDHVTRKESEEGIQGGFVNNDINKPDQGMMGIATVTGSEDQESATHNNIAQQPEVQKNYSPDEQVYVVFEEHTIALYETSTNELLRTWETSVAGTARLTVWDLEGQSFIYEITDDQGKNYSFTININEPNE